MGLEAAVVNLDEAVHALSAYFERLDSDPGLLDLTTERLDGLKRLKRKYGESEAVILEFCLSAEEELATLEDAEASEESLAQQLSAASAELEANWVTPRREVQAFIDDKMLLVAPLVPLGRVPRLQNLLRYTLRVDEARLGATLTQLRETAAQLGCTP